MSEEQPMLGLDVANCSGYTGEMSSTPSPDPLPVRVEILPVCAGQHALHCSRQGQPLIGYMVPGGLTFEQ